MIEKLKTARDRRSPGGRRRWPGRDAGVGVLCLTFLMLPAWLLIWLPI